MEYTQEVIQSLGGRDNVIDFSYHLINLKGYISNMKILYKDNDVKLKKIDGILEAFMSIEEYIYFPGEYEFGGTSQVKQLNIKLLLAGFDNTVYNQFLMSGVDPTMEDAYNGLIFLSNSLNTLIDGLEIVDGRVKGATDPLIHVAGAFSKVIAMLRNDIEFAEPNAYWDLVTQEIKNHCESI